MEPGEICCVYRVGWKNKMIAEQVLRGIQRFPVPVSSEEWRVPMVPHPFGETIYVGSSVNFDSRWARHDNPKYNRHGPFGKWLHRDNNLQKIKVEFLETVKEWNGSRDDLKKDIRRREFLWKERYPARFGKMDGLFMQPKQVQLAHKRKIDKASRNRNQEYQRRRNRKNKRNSRLVKKMKKLHVKLMVELLSMMRLRKRLRKRGTIYAAALLANCTKRKAR